MLSGEFLGIIWLVKGSHDAGSFLGIGKLPGLFGALGISSRLPGNGSIISIRSSVGLSISGWSGPKDSITTSGPRTAPVIELKRVFSAKRFPDPSVAAGSTSRIA